MTSRQDLAVKLIATPADRTGFIIGAGDVIGHEQQRMAQPFPSDNRPFFHRTSFSPTHKF
jgi:hypothetical protein